MKTRYFTSTKFDSVYNAMLATVTISFLFTLTSFIIPMPSVMTFVMHMIMLAGICLAVPSVIIILYRYHASVKRRIA